MSIQRLLAPRSIALIGASAWTDAVAVGNRAVGFDGELWRVHPTRPSAAGVTYYRSVEELPGTPDAAFLAVPSHEAPTVARSLAQRGAGGFVCFSAGFSETGTAQGKTLTEDLLRAAGPLPFFGPNCYGFVNFFDRVAMMPDQIVGTRVDRGVALICQSGTIALTLMFNHRSLPIGCLITVGNQSRLAVEDLIELLCDDPRVSAFGLYLEGIKDAERFARAADKARTAGKPIAAIKSGRTAAAARTAHSHTGALAGADRVFEAFCRQAGIARCDTLGTLCETLKLFHTGGPLPGRKVIVMGASGGDMAMTADVARDLELEFAPLPAASAARLGEILTARVTIANPFDIHTYLWFDPPALKRVFGEVLSSGYDAAGFMLDNPPEGKADAAAYEAVIDVFIAAAQGAPARAALIASLPETMNARMRERCLAGGVVPLQGQREALEALALAGGVGAAWARGAAVCIVKPGAAAGVGAAAPAGALSEHEGKAALAACGVPIPAGRLVPAGEAVEAAAALGFPVVIKAAAAHLEHKTEVGGVVLNIQSRAEAERAVERLRTLSDTLLVEQMLTDGLVEILIGVVLDPQFGQVLVLGAGGVLTEHHADSVALLPPWTADSIGRALGQLRIAGLFHGYRGKPAADVPALIDTALAVAAYAQRHADRIAEIDVNPVIVRPLGLGAVAVDVLIRLNPTTRRSDAMSDGVLTAKKDGVLEITLDRPKANAIDLKVSRRLNQVVSEFRDDPSLRIAIITGAGEKFFSPGWDLKAAAGGEESDADWGVGGFGGLNHPRNLNKPIIAAVNGIACGGGFELVLGTDIIVMEEHARFALPEINVGVLADAGTIKLRRRIPYHVAVEFLLTGRWMDAAEAKHWGLANHIVPKGQSMAKAREIAAQLCEGPPLLFPAIKQLLRHTETVPEHEAFELHDSLDLVQRVIRSDDLKEGTRAFSEKRKPRWTGR